MMMELAVGFVDVFAHRPLNGNPLAVVEGGEELSHDVMASIAREFNQAETTFILKSADRSADWILRSFTAAGVEVFGVGHNALGAWLWLAHQGRLGELGEPHIFRQQIGRNVLPVRVWRTGGAVYAALMQAPLTLGPTLADVMPVAESLGLAKSDLLLRPAPRVASTGATHLLVRIRDRATVDRATLDAAALIRATRNVVEGGCYLYAFEDGGSAAYARFFNPLVGLFEDSATGSAAGPLAAYLLAEHLLRIDDEFVVEQGTKMGRQSFLSIRFTPNAELSGSGVITMDGRLRIA
jgi:PhzF family phenazine biosynthesis protein